MQAGKYLRLEREIQRQQRWSEIEMIELEIEMIEIES